tara:strand:+ start:23 stop:247 length:225 start_codon:yes stop_codon:yes gene_type:complete
MGVVTNVGFTEWPKQGSMLHERVRVCFRYDTTQEIGGRIVRDDSEKPGMTIIALDDGRFVRATECMYTLDRFGH